MENLFDLFLEKKLSGDTQIKQAYADLYDVKLTWIEDVQGLTIQQLVDKICDELEAEGSDLTETHVDKIKERFALYPIVKKAPKSYLELAKAKRITEKNLENLKSSGGFEEYVVELSDALELIESMMKELS